MKDLRRFGILSACLGIFLASRSCAATETSKENSASPDIVTWQELASGDVDPHGYGLTVFKGSEVTRFEVEFEGVVQHPIIQNEKMILVRMGAPLEGSNVLAGMSGSPVYFYKNGKPHLLGAIAFGYNIPTAGKSLGGITPIRAMLNQQTTFASQRIPTSKRKNLEANYQALLGQMRSNREPPEILRQKILDAQKNLIDALSAPVPMGTYGGYAIELLQPRFSASAETSGPAADRKSELHRPEPGEAVSMMLVDGDFKIGATCTVTYATADRFWACGHPILMDGDVVVPARMAKIATSYKGPVEAFKMIESNGDPAGYISYDGAFAIEGYIRQLPANAMLPVQLHVSVGGKALKEIRFAVFRDKLYTGIYIDQVAHQAVENIWNTKRKATTKSTARISYDNSAITLYDTSTSGSVRMIGPFVVMADPWSAISKTAEMTGSLLASEWEFNVKNIDITMNLEPGDKVLFLDNLKALNAQGEVIDSLQPGDTAYLLIALRSEQGTKKFITKVPVMIPRGLDMKRGLYDFRTLSVLISAESGNNFVEKDEAKILRAKPENKKEFLQQLLTNEKDPQKLYIQILLPPTKLQDNKKKKIDRKIENSWQEVKTFDFLHGAKSSERKVITKELSSPLSDHILSIRGALSLTLTSGTTTAQTPYPDTNLDLDEFLEEN